MSLKISAETDFLLSMIHPGYSNELETSNCAWSDPAGNEINSLGVVGSASLNGTGANVFESQGAVSNVGSYALHANSNDTPTFGARFYIDLQGAPFNFVDGEQGKIEFDIRHVGIGSNWGCYMSASSNGTDEEVTILDNTETTFQSILHEWVHDADHRYLLFKALGTYDGGVYADNMSVKKKT